MFSSSSCWKVFRHFTNLITIFTLSSSDKVQTTAEEEQRCKCSRALLGFQSVPEIPGDIAERIWCDICSTLFWNIHQKLCGKLLVLQVCPVCLDEFNVGDKIAVCPCEHVFHTKLVFVWKGILLSTQQELLWITLEHTGTFLVPFWEVENACISSAQSGSADRTGAYCNDTCLCVCVYMLSYQSGGQLNMVKFNQDHFQTILSILHFLSMLGLPPIELNMHRLANSTWKIFWNSQQIFRINVFFGNWRKTARFSGDSLLVLLCRYTFLRGSLGGELTACNIELLGERWQHNYLCGVKCGQPVLLDFQVPSAVVGTEQLLSTVQAASKNWTRWKYSTCPSKRSPSLMSFHQLQELCCLIEMCLFPRGEKRLHTHARFAKDTFVWRAWECVKYNDVCPLCMCAMCVPNFAFTNNSFGHVWLQQDLQNGVEIDSPDVAQNASVWALRLSSERRCECQETTSNKLQEQHKEVAGCWSKRWCYECVFVCVLVCTLFQP